jgi:carbamoyltransferase
MLILSLHHGYHDSAAALFDDYTLVAAVAEERLNRVKCSGGFPDRALAEVLSIGRAERRDVDVVVTTRTLYRRRYYTHVNARKRFHERLRQLAGRGYAELRDMSFELSITPGSTAHDIFDGAMFLADLGLRPQAQIFFSNHHFSHALPALFFTDWDDALLYTADGVGDEVMYSHNLFRRGKLTNLYGDDRWLRRPDRVGSLGRAYSYVTAALGWQMNRHEGKLTGLAAHGAPTLLPEMRRHFRITNDALIEMDFADHRGDARVVSCAGEGRDARERCGLDTSVAGGLHRRGGSSAGRTASSAPSRA